MDETIRNPKLKEIVEGLDKRVEQETVEIRSILDRINSPALSREVGSCQQIYKKWEIIHAHLSKGAEIGVNRPTEMIDMKKDIHSMIESKDGKTPVNESPPIVDGQAEAPKPGEPSPRAQPTTSQAEIPRPPPEKPKEDIMLDHYVYYSLTEEGYTNEPVAWNDGFNPHMYIERCFIIDIKGKSGPKLNLIYPSQKTEAPEMMYFSYPDTRDVVLTLQTILHDVDEWDRGGYKHHTVVIDKKLLKGKTISLRSVIDAIFKFDKDNPKPIGIIPPLSISREDNKEFSYKSKLRGVTDFSLAATANHLTESDYNKVNFTLKTMNSGNPAENMAYAIYLIELLHLDCGIENLRVVTTEPERWEIADKFNLFITQLKMRDKIMAVNKSLWQWFRSSESGTYNRISGNERIYQIINECR